jgi:DnaJ-class molecular chaperone
MSSKDLYAILEVSKDASPTQIKSSYKKLSVKWHPDKNQNNVEEATSKFTEISNAYNILKDPAKRKTYDQFGYDAVNDNNTGGHGVNPFDMFKDMFGGFNFSGENEVPDVEVVVTVSLEELFSGTTKHIKYERYSLCHKCDGRGTKNKDSICKVCSGKGVKLVRMPFGMMQSVCNDCAGNGIDPSAEKCSNCEGNSCIIEKCEHEIEIKKGIHNKIPIVIEDIGNEIRKAERSNKKRTNLVCIIQELKHDRFSRGIVNKEIGTISEENLIIDINIKFEESIVGFEKVIEHLDGKNIKFTINEHTNQNDIFVIKGFGMPCYNSNDKGDLLVKINVSYPKLTLIQKEKIWQALSNDPYPKLHKTSPSIITYNDYKKEQNMKHKYKARKNNDDGNGTEFRNVQCAQQ